MSESHWGVRSFRGPLLTVACAVALMAGLVALFYWSPWKEPTETDWLGTYEAWSEGVEATLAAEGAVTRAACESTFDDEVGDPPAERLQSAAEAARRGCATLTSAGWQDAQSDVVRAILDSHAEAEAEDPVPEPRVQPDFSELASPVAGRKVDVYCWPEARWTPFAERYALLRGDDELSLKGTSDTARNRIDLEPGVCAALRRYERRIRPIPLSFQNFELAEAVVVLTHHAEHFGSPKASEPERECYAVQHVRPFIRAAGWGPGFQEEIALHAWDLGYTQLPQQLRSPECRDGGALDQNPDSNAWP